MKPLTTKQSKVLSAIKTFIIDNGFSPTQRELTKLLEFASNNSIAQYIKALAKMGYITFDDEVYARSIVVNVL